MPDNQEVNPTREGDVPPVVRIGRAAVAASAAGHGIVLLYRDFPAPLLTAIWARHFAEAESAKTAIVCDQRSCRSATESLDDKWLVLVQEPTLLRPLAHAVQEKLLAGASCPTIFCRYVQADCEDLPIPALVFRAVGKACTEAGVWLNRSTSPSPLAFGGRAPVVDLAEVVESHVNRLLASSLASYDECEVVRALLKGTALSNANRHDTPDRVEAGRDDFATVKRLLASPGVTDSEGITDPLAVAMVRRVNTFLKPAVATRTARTDGDEETEPCSITRKELVDLGNTSSECVAQLVRQLMREGGSGYEAYRRLGLIREAPRSESWPEGPSEQEWCRRLQSWTEKMVRTHFDSLREQGIISAERPRANGPWIYQVPHELQVTRSILSNLPLPEAAREQDGLPSAAPACPPARADQTN